MKSSLKFRHEKSISDAVSLVALKWSRELCFHMHHILGKMSNSCKQNWENACWRLVCKVGVVVSDYLWRSTISSSRKFSGHGTTYPDVEENTLDMLFDSARAYVAKVLTLGAKAVL